MEKKYPYLSEDGKTIFLAPGFQTETREEWEKREQLPEPPPEIFVPPFSPAEIDALLENENLPEVIAGNDRFYVLNNGELIDRFTSSPIDNHYTNRDKIKSLLDTINTWLETEDNAFFYKLIEEFRIQYGTLYQLKCHYEDKNADANDVICVIVSEYVFGI